MRAVVLRLKAIISNAVLGGEETNVSAALPAADSVADVKAALREIEQELLRHQISAKWELMPYGASPTARAAVDLCLCGHSGPQSIQLDSTCIFEGARFPGTNARV